MRLLRRCDTSQFSLTKDLSGEDSILPYAVLSHTWGADTAEVTFRDMTNSTGKDKAGYKKIRFCSEQAKQDGLQYIWIHTCCTDKANKAELTHAINWYRNAIRCYVYLSDVSSPARESNKEESTPLWELQFRKSRWFTRGWTLQELLAPKTVEFFSKEGKRLGDRLSLEQPIHETSGIPVSALQGAPLSQFSVDKRLLWNKDWQTKLEEDKSYSLLGIFNVYITPFYSEGTGRAFGMLMDEINKLSRCIQVVRLTDPRDDKRRIEETKGGLLEGPYRWAVEHPNFQQ
jgi:hypothetical protein